MNKELLKKFTSKLEVFHRKRPLGNKQQEKNDGCDKPSSGRRSSRRPRA
jgi:hypothetical protein